MFDYKPDLTKVKADVAGGLIPGELDGKHNDTGEVIGRRLTLHDGSCSCRRHELLIPPHATEMLRDLDLIIQRYEDQRIPGTRDLMILFTVRFEPGGTFHSQFELARSFAWAKLCVERKTPVVLVQHQPGLSGYVDGKAHVHMLIFARELHDSNFLGFTPLVKSSPKVVLAAEWAAWLAQHR
jgi:hypothetical protein